MADRSTGRDQGVGGIEPADAPKSSNWQGSQQGAGTAGEGGGFTATLGSGTSGDTRVGGVSDLTSQEGSDKSVGQRAKEGVQGLTGGGGGEGIKGLTDDSNEGKGIGQRMKEGIQGLTGGDQGGVSDLTSDDNSSVGNLSGGETGGFRDLTQGGQ